MFQMTNFPFVLCFISEKKELTFHEKEDTKTSIKQNST